MTATDALDFIQSGGSLAFALIVIWALLSGKVHTDGEFKDLKKRFDEVDTLNKTANDELRRQSATNARLVELSMLQRQEAENIRREPYKRETNDG